MLPVVYGNGQIWLEINPRVTSVNAGLGITIGGASTPGFNEQTVRTAVMLESGQTFAIGGLIQNSVTPRPTRCRSSASCRSSEPAFSRVQHEQTRERAGDPGHPAAGGPDELRPGSEAAAGHETRNPDDYELFLENILEAPRGQRKVWNGRCYNAAWKCDPTAGDLPLRGRGVHGRGEWADGWRVARPRGPVTPVPASPATVPAAAVLPAPVPGA